jgi:hypothetical protein
MGNYPALSNLRERVERSIFHWIRLKLVEENYLPDITDYTNDPAGTASYVAAIATKAGANGFAIEIFNHSGSQEKILKKVPRIVLQHRLDLVGSIGSEFGSNYFIPVPGGFNRQSQPLRTTDVYLDIHLVSNSAKQDRVLHAVLMACISQARYIPFYDDPEEKFLVEYVSHRDYPDTTSGILENIYTYKCCDLWLEEPNVDDTLVVPITEITLETETTQGGEVDSVEEMVIVPEEE